MDWIEFAKPTPAKLFVFILLFLVFPLPISFSPFFIPLGGILFLFMPQTFSSFLVYLIVVPYILSCVVLSAFYKYRKERKILAKVNKR